MGAYYLDMVKAKVRILLRLQLILSVLLNFGIFISMKKILFIIIVLTITSCASHSKCSAYGSIDVIELTDTLNLTING